MTDRSASDTKDASSVRGCATVSRAGGDYCALRPSRSIRTYRFWPHACGDRVMTCVWTKRRWCSRRAFGGMKRRIVPFAATTRVRFPPCAFFSRYSPACRWSARRHGDAFPLAVPSMCFLPLLGAPLLRTRNVSAPVREHTRHRARTSPTASASVWRS